MTAVLSPRTRAELAIAPDNVREVLDRSILADCLDFVLDVER
ncbi:MAG: hypothetical protein QOK12_2913 [Mycobacterium sp.]|nr:hypothetical protein [Mycobacterium sp.]